MNPQLTPGQVAEIPIGRLVPDPDQPRKSFDEGSLEQLAASLKRRVQVPLLVRPGKSGKFIIHDGERRWRAAKLAKLKKLPVLLAEATENEQDLRTEQLAVNNLREQLSTMEVARVLADLKRKHFASDNELAAHLDAQGLPAMTPKQIRDAIALIDLPDWAQAMIDAGQLETSSAVKLRAAMPYPKVLKGVHETLQDELQWTGRIIGQDVVNALRFNFPDAGVDLSYTESWHAGLVGAVHFNPKVVCKGCEHLVTIEGTKFCMNPPEFERKNAEAKAAGLLPGGKKPENPAATTEAAAQQNAEAKEESRARTLGEKARDYLHAYLVRRIVAHMQGGDGIHQIDITDELLAWHAMRRPGEVRSYNRAAIIPYEARNEAGIKCLEHLFAAKDLEPPKLHAAIEIAHELCWRETQVICHELWGAAIENVWQMDEDFVNLFRKAELLHLVETHGLELEEGRDWKKLKVVELKKEILARADQVQRPQMLQDVYDQIAEPWVPWSERGPCKHGVEAMDWCEQCDAEMYDDKGEDEEA